ncbi:MAG: PQQ-dependent sugar dehydrogenase [Gammaproteobacteria bacterium]|nr:PQQ-dependent sugar dehydrogenase [Gammaproteobacteria bacterium]
MLRMTSLMPLALLLLGCGSSANGQASYASGGQGFAVETLAEGLEHPWAMAFLPDGEVLITERPGRLRIWRDGVLLEKPVSGLPAVRASGQGGLLDLALHPAFAENRWLYFSYAADHQRGISTHVARGRYHDGALSQVQRLFVAEPAGSGGRHFGSRLLFDDAGYLYITVGDRGDMPRAQRLDDHAGSTLRLHDDGRIPKDNPFLDTPGARPELYTIGNRNAQGMTLHPQTRAIWQVEHGPRGGDELNRIEAGLNYGWPVITHGINYTGTRIGEGIQEMEGMEQPLYHWTPSIAPSGMAFYTGEAFPNWQSNLFVGALAHRHLARLVMDGDKVIQEEQLLKELGQRIRDVRQGPDGLLWLLTDEKNGALLRLSPVP